MSAIACGLALAAALAPVNAAAAQTCGAGKTRADMTNANAQAVYDCLKKSMFENYNKGGKGWIPAEVVKEYRNWKLANTAPAAPGFHGERYLMTWVNETGYDAYTDFRDEDVSIPAGTVIVKESFDVAENGSAKAGPLFIMEKVEEGRSPETMDWYYMMISPKGKPVAVNVVSACSECHMENFGQQGALGYPAEDVRVAK
ncbi:cytochrome P460 family protein [Nisaea acidiphila]|uniref:Cytochrome P460 family protein n=1 Tax=Nisaea acidiphila TaxID=1862145 RepID=A0A9J7ATS0_9PROT|nr:cytochrome P460 family protein [Nisaea acidiphila]UUX49881.1 cytochrome P460 family protein [Nisaea acidiphila]